MSKLLVLVANPSKTSIGTVVGNAFIDKYKELNSGHTVTYLNLFDIYVPELNAYTLSAWDSLDKGTPFNELSEVQQKQLKASEELLNQFLNYDKYLLLSPLWNSNIPARLHSYLDILCVPQKTFKYTEKGAQGLINGKKALHIHAAGKIYNQGEISYPSAIVKEVFNLIGIIDFYDVLVHGQQQERNRQDEIRLNAIKDVEKIAMEF